MPVNSTSDESQKYLVGPAAYLLHSVDAQIIYSKQYYSEPIFYEYDLASLPTTWDIEATVQAVPFDSRVLDLGGGDGRLTFAIEDAGKLLHADVVDLSSVALSHCTVEAQRREIPHKISTHCEDIFDLSPSLKAQKYDVVLFGDVVLHYVYSMARLEEILRVATSVLEKRTGIVVATSFDDDSVTSPAHLDGTVNVIPQRDSNNTVRLFWWSYRFDHNLNILYRTVFVETGKSPTGEVEGIISDLHDKLWSPTEISGAGQKAGLKLRSKQTGKVDDGAVTGAKTAISVFEHDI